MSRRQHFLRSAFSPSKIIVFVIVVAFIAVVFDSVQTAAWKSEPFRSVSPGPTNTPTYTATNTPTPQPVCSPLLLWDQIAGGQGTNGTASQDFDTANDAFDAEAADDFQLGSGTAVVIRKIIVRGIYFNGSGPAESFNVRFYGYCGLPCGLDRAFTGLSYTHDGDKFIINIPNYSTGNLTGWVSVQARMDLSSGGQWAWMNREQFQFMGPSTWKNPGGGYSIPQCLNFATRGSTCNIDPAYPDQAFQIIGYRPAGACTVPTLTATPTATSTLTTTPTSTPTVVPSPSVSPSPSGTPTGTPLPACGPIEVLWDQMESAGTGGTASQDFETSLDAYDATAQDDFHVGSGSAWTIRRIAFRGQYFNGSGPADSFNVGFDGGVVRGLSYTRSGDVFTIQLPQPLRSLFHVFDLSVQAKMDFAVGGQWAWTDRAPQGFLFPASWGNPGGGYMIPQCVNFDRRGSVCGIDPDFPEQAFRIEGNQGFCSPPALISGTITYGNAIPAATRPVTNVLVNGTGSVAVSTTTGFPDGGYTLTGFGAGSYTVTPTKTGGVNASITSFDAAKIAQHAAGVPPGLNATQLIVADVSGNGTVTSFDAAQVARYAAAISGSGATGSWIFRPVNTTYPEVTANITGQDYTALLMGEVSGNWTNTGARPANGFNPNALAWLIGGGF